MAPAEVNVISGYIAGGEGAFHWPTHRVRYSFLHGLGTQVQLLLNRLGIHSYTIGKHFHPRPEKAEIMVFLQQRTTRTTQRTKYPAQYWRHEHVWRGLDLAKTEAASYTVCPKCSQLRVNQIWLLGPDVMNAF